jgi:hypothetical protein
MHWPGVDGCVLVLCYGTRQALMAFGKVDISTIEDRFTITIVTQPFWWPIET